MIAGKQKTFGRSFANRGYAYIMTVERGHVNLLVDQPFLEEWCYFRVRRWHHLY